MSNHSNFRAQKNSTDVQAIESTWERILYEDNHLIIYNKRPSEIVQADKTGDIPLSDKLKQYLKVKYHKPGNVFLGVVHRLDRPVSGALIFARTSKALSRLNEMLRCGDIRKVYWALVRNKPPQDSGKLSGYISRDKQKNKSFISDRPGKGIREASLDYRIIGHSNRYYLMEIILLTGRHHQIRAQLAFIGCPIRGDLKYGYPRTNPGGFIHLHSRTIEFIHPVTKEEIKVSAPLPADPLWQLFNQE